MGKKHKTCIDDRIIREALESVRLVAEIIRKNERNMVYTSRSEAEALDKAVTALEDAVNELEGNL